MIFRKLLKNFIDKFHIKLTSLNRVFFIQIFREIIVVLFDPLGLLVQVIAVVRVVDHLNIKIKRLLI